MPAVPLIQSQAHRVVGLANALPVYPILESSACLGTRAASSGGVLGSGEPYSDCAARMARLSEDLGAAHSATIVQSFNRAAFPCCASISKLSIFPSYCRSQTEHVCFLLMDRPGNPHSSHLGQQGGPLQSQFGRCAAWSANDPAKPLQRFNDQDTI
jgi:hypothetical protein